MVPHVTSTRTRLLVAAPGLLLVAHLTTASRGVGAQAHVVTDDFERGLQRWTVHGGTRVRTEASGDPQHGRVLVLEPDGPEVRALLNGSERWPGVRLEADVRFLDSDDNYLGVIYNYRPTGRRTDFGVIYIKGNDSYLQANPHRDFNVSRTVYPEARVALTGEAAIVTGRWQPIKVEVVGSMCHFYVGDLTEPQMTFPWYEGTSGSIGLQPRSVGGAVWVDNVRATPLTALSYSGAPRPAASYAARSLLTSWEVYGPLTEADDDATKGLGGRRPWRPFRTDGRGAVVTGTVTDYHGPRTVAYFRTRIERPSDGPATLDLSTVDDLAVWVNGRFHWFVPRAGAAWFDFRVNPQHAGQKIPVALQRGTNEIVVRVRGGVYASGGFFAGIE